MRRLPERHAHRPPAMTPAPRSWIGKAGFCEEAFDSGVAVGAHRLPGEPAALMPGRRPFTFAGGTGLDLS